MSEHFTLEVMGSLTQAGWVEHETVFDASGRLTWQRVFIAPTLSLKLYK